MLRLANFYDDDVALQNGRNADGVAPDLQGKGAGVFGQADFALISAATFTDSSPRWSKKGAVG